MTDLRDALQRIANLRDSEADEPLDEAIAIAEKALCATPPEPKDDRKGDTEDTSCLLADPSLEGEMLASIAVSAKRIADRLYAALPPQAPAAPNFHEPTKRFHIGPEGATTTDTRQAPAAPDINEMVRKIEVKFGRLTINHYRDGWYVGGEDEILEQQLPDLLSALTSAARKNET